MLEDLPIDLLPDILCHLTRPEHLSACTLVNRTFNLYTTRELYRRVALFPWQSNSKDRVVQLLETLSRNIRVSSYVHILELRVFPKADQSKVTSQLCVNALNNCVNLRAVTWTRDGSLSDEIISTLATKGIRYLEFNAHAGSYYHPESLTRFRFLTTLFLLMPDRKTISILPQWIRATGESIRSITFLCKQATFITDGHLEQISSRTPNLEHFSVTNCTKITEKGILAILNANRDGICGLSLEGMGSTFDWDQLIAKVIECNVLRRLLKLSVTIPDQPEQMQRVLRLSEASDLQEISLFRVTSAHWSLTPDFVSGLVQRHGSSLTKLAVMKILVPTSVLRLLCHGCPNISSLFFVGEQGKLDEISGAISHLRHLSVMHLTLSFSIDEEGDGYGDVDIFDDRSSLLAVVERCSPELRQFGVNTRVWTVNKVFLKGPSGEWTRTVSLGQYERLEIPEAFLVVR